MRVTIPTKVRSQRGASLSVVLLLFLVCATVSSIVLAAATAAAGRQSQLMEADRRYYSVESACDLVWKELTKDSVTITRTCQYRTKPDGTYEVSDERSATVDDIELSSGSLPFKGRTWLELIATDYVFGCDHGDWATDCIVGDIAVDGDDTVEPAFSIQVPSNDVVFNDLAVSVAEDSGSDVDSELLDSLKCDVTITLQTNGDLKIVVSSASDTDDDVYSMSFDGKLSVEEDNQLSLVSREASGDTYELTNVTTVSWSPANLVRGGGGEST